MNLEKVVLCLNIDCTPIQTLFVKGITIIERCKTASSQYRSFIVK